MEFPSAYQGHGLFVEPVTPNAVRIHESGQLWTTSAHEKGIRMAQFLDDSLNGQGFRREMEGVFRAYPVFSQIHYR